MSAVRKTQRRADIPVRSRRTFLSDGHSGSLPGAARQECLAAADKNVRSPEISGTAPGAKRACYTPPPEFMRQTITSLNTPTTGTTYTPC